MKMKYDGSSLKKAYEDDAGFDLIASSGGSIAPGRTRVFQTDIRVAIPKGHVGFVRGRSGLAFKHGVWAFEGTIDSGFRGTIGIMLLNTSQDTYQVVTGNRIAQLVIVKVADIMPENDGNGLPDSDRSYSGLGSTGR